jgi:hypothetical protein
LQDARLARSDAIGATVTGEVAITNSRARGALVSGDLTLPEVRYQIIRQGAAQVAELEGVRRKGEPLVRPDQVNQQQAAAAPSIWKLDLRVRADNQVFVSGMGLESEWETDLRIRGTTASPVVTGEARVIRGTYSFAGQRFEVTTGEVAFTGSQPINPRLNIAASGEVKDVTITMSITGSSTNPQIRFASSPSLPQDEIMARLLFGGSVTELSALQLVQLGASLNSLRGSGGGLNPLGKLRSATGAARLRVLGGDEATGRGTALAAGFYLGNNIYLEVITDARASLPPRSRSPCRERSASSRKPEPQAAPTSTSATASNIDPLPRPPTLTNGTAITDRLGSRPDCSDSAAMSDPITIGRLYGRRSGHKLRQGQAALLEELLPAISVPEAKAIDARSLFGDDRPLHLEIGFGSGEHLAYRADLLPDHGFIGCEPFLNGVVGALQHIRDRHLPNVRLHMGDALDVLARLPDASLRFVYLLHPDPWPKARHAKRRWSIMDPST